MNASRAGVKMILSNYIPETKSEVESATGCFCKMADPDLEHSWLQCQIGRIIGKDELGYEIFHLHSVGHTWKEAYESWKKRKESILEFFA
jgi:hypothetical protein